MSDVPSPPASEPPQPDPGPAEDRPRRAWTFLGRLTRAVREQNWFAVALEVVIVVLGVVIGFQVTAWGQRQSDRAKEAVYLQQLAADLRETQRLVTDLDSSTAAADQAGARLVRVFYQPERPPRDSVLVWSFRARQIDTVRPVVGTAEALVATGDLALISNDSLRAAVTAYLDVSRDRVLLLEGLRDSWLQAAEALDRRIDRASTIEAATAAGALDPVTRQNPYRILPEGERRDPFAFDVDAFLTDREAFAAVDLMHSRKNPMRYFRGLMRDDAAALLRDVDAELDR